MRWDRLRSVVPYLRGVGVREQFDRCRQVWQVEECFRITKHDLRARPVFHLIGRRIRATWPGAWRFRSGACRRVSSAKPSMTGRHYAIPS